MSAACDCRNCSPPIATRPCVSRWFLSWNAETDVRFSGDIGNHCNIGPNGPRWFLPTGGSSAASTNGHPTGGKGSGRPEAPCTAGPGSVGLPRCNGAPPALGDHAGSAAVGRVSGARRSGAGCGERGDDGRPCPPFQLLDALQVGVPSTRPTQVAGLAASVQWAGAWLAGSSHGRSLGMGRPGRRYDRQVRVVGGDPAGALMPGAPATGNGRTSLAGSMVG